MKTLTPLSLDLLGQFSLERNGRACDLAYKKGQGVLAFLAVTPNRRSSRVSLAALFWPDFPRAAALNNLRQVLRDLALAINEAPPGVAALRIDRASVGLAMDQVENDFSRFVCELPDCPTRPASDSCFPCLAAMEKRAALYRGEFMAGFFLEDCPGFEEWLQIQREAVHLRMLGLLDRLANCYERRGRIDKALGYAQMFMDMEPWSEDGLQRVLRLSARHGLRDAALSKYVRWCDAIKRELGVIPSAATQHLAERIRLGDTGLRVTSVACETMGEILPSMTMERRQVTVLYCELMVTGEPEPDCALAVLQGPQARCSEVIRQHSGYLVQARGGSLLAYFGYPQASENAARQAVQAALSVSCTQFSRLEVRVGVHTGVVISGVGTQLPDAIGSTSGLAIRLRQIIDGGQVAVSETTQRLVSGYFDCQSQGHYPFPGVTREIEVFKVSKASGARDRLESAGSLTRLIGRHDELSLLFAMWNEVLHVSLRTVLLRGEAGVGKSRLLLALKTALRGQGCVVRELRCFPEHQQSPFYPLAIMYSEVLGFRPEDTPEARFQKLAEYVGSDYANQDPDIVPLMAKMLSLPLCEPYREPSCSVLQQREKTLGILIERIFQLAEQQPFLMLVDDLHWADPSTLEFLRMFVAQRRKAPILAVLTARNEFLPPWPGRCVHSIEIAALSDADTAELVAAVAPDLAPATRHAIVERADGIPLFAEELAKTLGHHADSLIPSTLQDLLVARLDSLGPVKRAACAAASIGREFEIGLLRKIWHSAGDTLGQGLRVLVEAGIIEAKGTYGFRFKHSLIRDAAYQMQTQAERQAVHLRIAEALDANPLSAEVRPEFLAQHWAAGGETLRAIECWVAAGKLASQHSASQEAVLHFQSALRLAGNLPDAGRRAGIELEIQIGLGAAAFAAQGYASVAGAEAYARAMTLFSQDDVGGDAFAAAWGLWAGASSRAGYGHAQELAQKLLSMAERSGDVVHCQQGHFAVADTLYWQGRFVEARRHLELCRAAYRPLHHSRHVAEFGEDAGVTSTSYAAWVLWFLGHPEQAEQSCQSALALARQLGHPYSLAYALTFAAVLHCRLRQPAQALVIAQEALELTEKHGFSLWQIGATLSRGWALALQKQHAGVELVQQCVDKVRQAMNGVSLVVLEPLAEACLEVEMFAVAGEIAVEALTLGEAIGDHHVDAELYRIRGESLLGLAAGDGAAAEAELCFQHALVISRGQQAKSLELRAALSLATLWQKQGKTSDARRLLDEALLGFKESSALADLQDARRLQHTLVK